MIELVRYENEPIPVKFPPSVEDPDGVICEITPKFSTLEMSDKVREEQTRLTEQNAKGKLKNSAYQVALMRTWLDFNAETEKQLLKLQVVEINYLAEMIQEAIEERKKARKKN